MVPISPSKIYSNKNGHISSKISSTKIKAADRSFESNHKKLTIDRRNNSHTDYKWEPFFIDNVYNISNKKSSALNIMLNQKSKQLISIYKK